MSSGDKNVNFKEKLRTALTSTFKVISDDYQVKHNLKTNQIPTKLNFPELNNLNTKNDLIKARA